MAAVGRVLGTAIGWLAGASVGAQFARIALQTFALRALSKTPKQGSPPINVTLRSTIAARQLVFGQARCSGAMLDYFTYGSNNKYLVYVVGFAGHQTEDALDGYLDNYKVAAAYINNTTGAVTDPVFDGKLTWKTKRGTQAQTADSLLTAALPSVYTSNHRFRGISYDIVQMERSDKAFPNGAPQMVNRVLKGMRVYDPRLDSTNGGSGSHRRTDPSTWAYSRNLALCVRWILTGGSVVNDQTSRLIMYGLKEDDSRIDEAFWIAAANKCDESLSGANAPPSGAQARYTLDCEFSCEQSRRDILETMLAAGAGANLIYVHGKWRLYVGQYDAPVHSFTQDDLHGDLEIDDTSAAEDRYNAISSVYIDAARDYTEQTSKARTNAAYVTQDAGKDLPNEIPLRGVTDEYRAQRICELLLRQSRQMRTCKFRFGRQGLKVAPYETFTFDHSKYGWSGRVFRCLEREVERDDDGAMRTIITARAEASGVYDDLLTADYTTGTSVTNSLQSEAPDVPTGLVATSLVNAVELNWSLGAFWLQNGISEIWEYTSQTPFASATKVWQGRGTRAVIPHNDTTTRYYWVRVATVAGQVSTTEPATSGVAGVALAPGDIVLDPEFARATDETYWYKRLKSSSPSVTIATTGGNVAGLCTLTGNSEIISRRQPPFILTPGNYFTVSARIRRTTVFSGVTNAGAYLEIGAYRHETDPTSSTFNSTGAVAGFGGLKLSWSYIQSLYTTNQWYEISASVWLPPDSTLAIGDSLYVSAFLRTNNFKTGDTIQIDFLNLEFGASAPPHIVGSSEFGSGTTYGQNDSLLRKITFDGGTETFSLPPASAYIIGGKVYLEQRTSGTKTIDVTSGSGNTLYSAGGTTGARNLDGVGAEAVAECISATAWRLNGDLA